MLHVQQHDDGRSYSDIMQTPLEQWPDPAQGTMSSGPQGSPRVQKYGSGMVAVSIKA